MALSRLSLGGAPRASGTFYTNTQGQISALVTLDGVGAFTGAPDAQTYSGGFLYFESQYEREAGRRRRLRAQQLELEQETQAIKDDVDREIALLLREQEARELKRQELERLRVLAANLRADEARTAYGERVANALDRAIEKGTFSALAALDREIQRALEEEESLLLSITMMIADD